MIKGSHQTERGYSLIEVTIVMVLIIIVGAVIISRSSDLSSELVTQTEILKTQLRYAQTLAMSETGGNAFFGITCDANEYWLFGGTDTTNVLPLTDNAEFDANGDNKLELALKKIDVTAFTVLFNNKGIPCDDQGDPLDSDAIPEIKLTPDGKSSPEETITITQLTGFIP